ncbi:MAG: replication endonuclease [Zoogloeaceae bacterium]|jgi:hypothetical protein|nr:replication endonuclease [Zoogloeaceae bacterium]
MKRHGLRFLDSSVFREEWLVDVPEGWRDEARARHDGMLCLARNIRGGMGEKTKEEYKANTWLREFAEKLKKISRFIAADEYDIRETAKRLASEFMDAARRCVGGVEEARRELSRLAGKAGIKAPDESIRDRPAIARMTCNRWWIKRLRRARDMAVETAAREMGRVHAKREVYASDETVKRRGRQARRNAGYLADTIAHNECTGQDYTLSELAAKGVSNKAIRRGELMVRIRGCEEFAAAAGHKALFVTLTTPSKMHRMLAGGAENPKWNGATPRDAQDYLCKLWARARAAMNRRGVMRYGVRIAEPHHDGTVHWHLLAFMPKECLPVFEKTLKEYALLEDGNEPGAREHRCAFIRIEASKGTAAGYVAKYISKNIDGYSVQLDFESGMEAVTASERVEAWAACWRVRQFQPFGCPPVTLWRELRRLAPDAGHGKTLEAARRAACDTVSWAGFMTAMGGAGVKRKDMPLGIARTRAGERWDFQNGAAYPEAQSQYGDDAKPAIYGVMEGRKAWPSVRYRWSVGRKPAVSAPRTCINNCTVEKAENDKRNADTRRNDGRKPEEDAKSMGFHARAYPVDSRGLSGTSDSIDKSYRASGAIP